MDFKEHVLELIEKATGTEIAIDLLETPPELEMGDLAFPCFSLAKTLRKAPPMIANELLEKIGADEYIEKVEAVGGYLNFFFRREKFAQEIVNEIQKGKANYGKSDLGNGKTVIVEFSSPNIAKPFHIGHLFATSLGNSLAKIYDFLGYNVEKVNHLGDWGTQFGRLIAAYKKWGDKEIIEKDPINELLKIYIRFHDEMEEKPEYIEEAREEFRKLEEGNEENVALWKWFREVSLAEFEESYKQLGVEFDSYNGEAFYTDKMDEAIKEIKDKNLLVESEGAQVVRLDDENIPPCMILKSDGTTIYATRDITAALYRKKTYDFSKNIYVVGSPQALHFKQVFSVLRRMGYDWWDDCNFVGFGQVKFPDRKMATRSGDIVMLKEVLAESIDKTRSVMEGNNIENVDEVAKKVGIGAVVYTLLRNSREKDIVFVWEDILDFEGESGPYVQYSYARGQSILRRAEIDFKDAKITGEITREEYELCRNLAEFQNVVASAAEKNEPFYVNRYVTLIAKLFNKFYNTCPILKADEETQKMRLLIVDATCQVLKSGLALLGIEVVDRM